MLKIYYSQACKTSHARQKGVTLVITLIILVAMTLASIAMVRSVDTSNIIAGNFAFQQSARQAADIGTEDAVKVLLPSVVAQKLEKCTINCPVGYISWREPLEEPPVKTWSSFWESVRARATAMPINATTGNRVFYIVQALCDQNGQNGKCIVSPGGAIVSCEGGDAGATTQKCITKDQIYYRITTRVEGPRNSVAYTQTIIAM